MNPDVLCVSRVSNYIAIPLDGYFCGVPQPAVVSSEPVQHVDRRESLFRAAYTRGIKRGLRPFTKNANRGHAKRHL